jgi:hypothetical protein
MGVMMYEMMKGNIKLKGKKRKEKMKKILKEKIGMNKLIYKEEKELIREMLKRNKENRIGEGNEGVEEIKEN